MCDVGISTKEARLRGKQEKLEDIDGHNRVCYST
jgi:hypothetical protein